MSVISVWSVNDDLKYSSNISTQPSTEYGRYYLDPFVVYTGARNMFICMTDTSIDRLRDISELKVTAKYANINTGSVNIQVLIKYKQTNIPNGFTEFYVPMEARINVWKGYATNTGLIFKDSLIETVSLQSNSTQTWTFDFMGTPTSIVSSNIINVWQDERPGFEYTEIPNDSITAEGTTGGTNIVSGYCYTTVTNSSGTYYGILPLTSYISMEKYLYANTEQLVLENVPTIKTGLTEAVKTLNGPVSVIYSRDDDYVKLSYNIKTESSNSAGDCYINTAVYNIHVEYKIHSHRELFLVPMYIGVNNAIKITEYFLGGGDYKGTVTHTVGIYDQMAQKTSRYGYAGIWSGATQTTTASVTTVATVTINGKTVGNFEIQPNGSTVSFTLPERFYRGINTNYDRQPFVQY